MNTPRTSTLLTLLLVLTLFASACGGTTTPTSAPVVKTATSQVPAGDQPTAAPQSTQAPAATDKPAPTDVPPTAVPPTGTPKPQSANLGDVVEKDGYFIAAMAVEDPATPGLFYEAKEGKRLIAVEIVLGNISADVRTINPLNTTLLDSEGFKYTPELGGRDDGQIALVDLYPNERVRGWIAFEIPSEAVAASVKYQVKMGGTTLQAGLTASASGPGIPVWPERTPPDLPRLGDVVELDGYSLSASTVEDPTAPGMFYEPKPGMKVIAVEITVGNVSGETHTVNPLNSVLVDSNGFLYVPELGGRDDGQIQVVDLAAGEKAKGWVAFVIPEDATPESIKYQISSMGGPVLHVGLAAP